MHYPQALQAIIDFIDDFDNGDLDEDLDLGGALTEHRSTLRDLHGDYDEFADDEGSDGYQIWIAICDAERGLDQIAAEAGIPSVDDCELDPDHCI